MPGLGTTLPPPAIGFEGRAIPGECDIGLLIAGLAAGCAAGRLTVGARGAEGRLMLPGEGRAGETAGRAACRDGPTLGLAAGLGVGRAAGFGVGRLTAGLGRAGAWRAAPPPPPPPLPPPPPPPRGPKAICADGSSSITPSAAIKSSDFMDGSPYFAAGLRTNFTSASANG